MVRFSNILPQVDNMWEQGENLTKICHKAQLPISMGLSPEQTVLFQGVIEEDSSITPWLVVLRQDTAQVRG